MNKLKFKQIPKDRLFYDKWEYSIKFTLEEVTAMHSLDHLRIDEILNRRKAWRQQAAKRASWNSPQSSMLSRMGLDPDWPTITEGTYHRLHSFLDILLLCNFKFKLVTSMSTGWIYSNDIKLIEDLSNNSIITEKSYSQAVVNRPKNTIKLKNARHIYRSYFKEKKLSAEEKNNIKNWLFGQTNVRIGPSLRQCLETDTKYFREYFFIDHDTESCVTMLCLIQPGLLRKTVQIISA